MTKDTKSLIQEGEKLEDLLHGKLKILQKEEGYRFSVDPLLLTDFIKINEDDKIIDLGTGSGVMPLILTDKADAKNIIGIDIQEEIVDMARRSVKYNKLGNKIEIALWDLKNLNKKYEAESFDVVISNPPYIPVKAGKINPNEEKAIARHEIMADLGDVLSAAKYLLKVKGRVYLVYPAVRTVDLMVAFREQGLEPKEIKFVHSNENTSAKLILVKAIKGGKPEVNITKPLSIYNLEGDYTDTASRILNNGIDLMKGQ